MFIFLFPLYMYFILSFRGVVELRHLKELCEKEGKHCENVYVWNEKIGDFTSLLNDSFNGKKSVDTKSLEGQVVRVIAHHMFPYTIASNFSNDLSGFLGEMWTLVQEAYKFKSEVKPMSYDDGLEIIMKGEADILLAAAVEKKGLANVEFSQPYFYNWYHLYVKKPEPKASSSSYLRTLDNNLWLASVLLFLVLSVLLWATAKYLNTNWLSERRVSLPSCFLAVCGGFLNQGFDIHLRSYSCRIQVLTALLFGVLLYAGMNAGLVAKLSVLHVDLPFKNLHEISSMKTHSLCVRTNSFVYNNFTDENKTVLPQWTGIINGPGCLNINSQKNLAKILCDDNLIFLENRVVMSTVIKDFEVPCEITYLKEKYFEKANSFIYWKNFNSRKLINAFVRKLSTTGVLQRLQHKWIQQDLPNNGQNIQMPEVNIFHVNGIIYIYISMACISLLILGIEMFLNGKKNREKQYK